MGKVEQKAGQVRGENFRAGECFQRLGGRFFPQAIADAGLGTPCAPPALVGSGARHAHGFQPGQSKAGLEARHTGKSAIDDDAHALDRQRGFGDGGRQHDLAAARRRGLYGAILRLPVHGPVERRDVDIWRP